MDEHCDTCRYWAMDPDAPDEGTCRRLPPVLIVLPMDNHNTPFLDMSRQPETEADDWCGEWAPREETT